MTDSTQENKSNCYDCLGLVFRCECFERYRRERRINELLRKARNERRREIKILLLGTGDSGKSTVMKQMKVLNGESLVNEENIDSVRFLVYRNILRSFRILIDARRVLNFPWSNTANEQFADILMNADTKQYIFMEYFRRFQPHMRSIWSDHSIQDTFQRRHLFYISDGFGYFMEHFDRIVSQNYIPTDDDVLRCREATRVISEYSVSYKSIIFRFIDVGGQQSQRRKWLHVMDSVKSILFIVSSIEYDLYLVEDLSKNRLEDSIETFQSIVENPLFIENVAFILFLNKKDMLEDKLRVIKNNCQNNVDDPELKNTIDKYCQDFCGDPTSAEDVQNYFENKFRLVFAYATSKAIKAQQDFRRRQRLLSKSEDEYGPTLYCHRTCAVDTKNMKVVFQAVRNRILAENIRTLMIV